VNTIEWDSRPKLVARVVQAEAETVRARAQVVSLLRFIGGVGGLALLGEAVEYMRADGSMEIHS